MSRTLDGNRLKGLKVSGAKMSANLTDAVESVGFSMSYDQVTEMSLSIADNLDLSLFRSGVLKEGSTLTYDGWVMTVGPVEVRSGAIGPQLSVRANSRTVTRLRAQTGAKNWGTVDVTAWAWDLVKSVGGQPVMQFGLPRRQVIRAKPEGDNAESSWDVLVRVARESGVWLFENGPWMVMGKPSWLDATTYIRREIPLYWHHWSDYSEGLAGMPTYRLDPGSSPAETLGLRLVSVDADHAVPGDVVTLSGRGVGRMGGKWIVTSVDYPFTVGSPVAVSCVRPIDPKVST